jgi:L-alanine-DL-glutamate epimerase-like enolase superfamily enzyme
MPATTTLRALRAHVFRAPIAVPVTNSFGTMTNRPMLVVEIEDSEGARGWGEVWCNFPVVGAEHRARLLDSVFAPLVVGEPLGDPTAHFDRLTRRTHAQVLQTGEPGSFAQCIAGIDQALCDLAARRVGEPLWRALAGRAAAGSPTAPHSLPDGDAADGEPSRAHQEPGPAVRVYASGLGPDDATAPALARRSEGHRAFKLKVGFGRARDLANARALREALGPGATLMVDANQAWSLDEAVAMASALHEFDLRWLEEPLAADAPLDAWQRLARASAVPLAAGENLRGYAAFGAAIDARALAVVQPDVGKWGGYTGCLAVARRATANDVAFCPHWLGGGVGLMASLQLLAAAGARGFAEVDANPNPLRECFPLPPVHDGEVTLPAAPGLGFVPDLAALREFRVSR